MRQRLPPGSPFLALAVAAGLGAAAFFISHLGAVFDRACVPADFPAYPGLQVQAEYHDQGGAADQCNAVWSVDADGAAVADYYTRRLQSGDWELLDGGGNPLLFRRHSHPATTGSLAISAGRPTTLIFYLRMPNP